MILALLIICADPNYLQIFVDDGEQSRLLKAELTRDWKSNPTGGPPSAWLAEFDARRARMMERVTISRVPWALRDKPAPFYRFGDYGECNGFNPKTFIASGVPLLTVEAIIANHDLDISAWKEECLAREAIADGWHRLTILKWLKNQHGIDLCDPLILNTHWPELNPDNVEELRNQFSSMAGFPKRTDPQLPPRPYVPMPWRED